MEDTRPMLANSATKRTALTPEADQADPKQCRVCGKYFDRKDALRRHLHIHDRDRPPPKSRRTACFACVRSKIKCPGERPCCSRCLKRGLACLYEQDRHPNRQGHPQDGTYAGSYSTEETSAPGPQPFDLQGIPAQLTPKISEDVYTPNPPQPFANHALGGILPPSFADTNLHSPMDWIFFDSLDDVFPNPMQTMLHNPSLLGANDPVMAAVLNNGIPEQAQQVFAPESVVDAGTPLSRIQDSQLEDSGVPDDRWPMEWRAVPVQLSSLPALQKADGQDSAIYPSHFSLPSVGEPALASLRGFLQTLPEKSPWQPVSLDAFPSKDQVDYFVDLYFLHFDRFFPVIHRPTFDPAKEPILTLAMSVIGACYSGFDSARSFGTSLSELTRRLLLFMAEYDHRFVRTEWYVTAQLLQSIHGLSSGSKRLYELAEANRSSVVSNARCMKLFEPHKYGDGRDANENDLQQRWEDWVRVEKARRLAWAVYDWDCSSAFCRNARPSISMLEIRTELPCSTEHWEAASPQAWAALHPWRSLKPPTLDFRATMNGLFDGTESSVAKIVDDYHRLLVVSTLARACWDMRESMFEPGAAFIPTRHIQPANIESVVTVMDQLGGPLKPAKRSTSPRALETLAHRTYIIRMASILSTDESVDYMHLIWAKGPRAQEAQEYLMKWASRHPEKVRRTVYVCAQILSVSRQFPYNHPHEPYFTFHAGFALWTMAGLLLASSPPQEAAARPSTGGPNGSSTRRVVCQLDWLGAQDAPEALVVRDWIENGGNHVVRMHGVPDIASEQGLHQTLEQTASLLRRMPVWGIAQPFLNAILRVLHPEDET